MKKSESLRGQIVGHMGQPINFGNDYSPNAMKRQLTATLELMQNYFDLMRKENFTLLETLKRAVDLIDDLELASDRFSPCQASKDIKNLLDELETKGA